MNPDYLILSCLASVSLHAWNGKEIIIDKAYKKSISFMIRYYSDYEWAQIRTQLAVEGFRKANKYVGYNLDSPRFLICNHISHMLFPVAEDIYTKYKSELTSSEKTCFDYLLSLHNREILHGLRIVEISKDYRDSGFVVVAREQDKEKGEELFNIYKTAMNKIAHEDETVQYKEMTYENGTVTQWIKYRVYPNGGYSMNAYGIEVKPATNSWTNLKNFVWNEKFLYAMGGLSALYLGYEYLNQ